MAHTTPVSRQIILRGREVPVTREGGGHEADEINESESTRGDEEKEEEVGNSEAKKKKIKLIGQEPHTCGPGGEPIRGPGGQSECLIPRAGHGFLGRA